MIIIMYRFFLPGKKPRPIRALLLSIPISQYPFIIYVIYPALDPTQTASSFIETDRTILASAYRNWDLIVLKRTILILY